MTKRIPLLLLLIGGSLFLSFVLIIAASISWKIALFLMPGLVAGMMVVFNPFLGVLLLVFLAPLDAIANLASNYLPVSAYKLLTVATLSGYILHTYNLPRDQRLGKGLVTMRYVVLLAMLMLVSYFLSEYKTLGRSHLIGFYGVILLFFIMVFEVTNTKRLELMVLCFVVTGLISGTLVVLETFLGIRLLSTGDAAVSAQWQGYARSAGASDYNPTTASHMLLTSTVMAIVLFIESPRWRILTASTAVIGMGALLLTFSRSASIAFVLVALAFAIRHRKHKLFPLSTMLIILGIGAGLPFVPDLYWERMGTLLNFDTDRTLWRRISYNLIGLQLLAENPIFGIGPGNFPLYYLSTDFRWFPGRELAPRQLHNSFLEVGVEFGLMGFAFFVLVMGSSLRNALNAVRSTIPIVKDYSISLMYGFSAFLLASVFMPNEDTKFMWLLPGLCCAAGLVAQKTLKSQTLIQNKDTS